MENEPEKNPDPSILPLLVKNHRRFAAFLKTRVRNSDDAEDILQAAFANAIEKEFSLRDKENAVAWFYRLVRNALIDFYRKQGTHNRLFDSNNESIVEMAEIDQELNSTICECLNDIIPTLKPEYRELLQRVDLNGQRVDDVAKSLEITPNNASVRLHRGRLALRERMVQVCGTCAIHGCLDCTCKSC